MIMQSADISVSFEFRLFGDESWRELQITPEEFFDPPGEGQERLDSYSIPRFLDQRKFLDIEPEKVSHVRTRVEDALDGIWREEYKAFFNRGRCTIIRRRSNDPKDPDHVVFQVIVSESNTMATVFCRFADDDIVVTDYGADIDGEIREFLPDDEKPPCKD